MNNLILDEDYIEKEVNFIPPISRQKYKYLSNEFLEKYKDINPFPTQLGLFTYVRTYSQFLPTEKRREKWFETVARAVDFNISLSPNSSVREAEELFDNIFNLRQFLSGRTLWSGGNGISKKYIMSNFNCAFIVADEVDAFVETFYLLLVGAGVGFRALKDDVKNLPRFRQNISIEHEYYSPVPKDKRIEYTQIENIDNNNTIKLTVGDSKEGWMQSLEFFLKVYTENSYDKVSKISINYDNVRPKGERLKRFGGFSSGHQSLHKMFSKIYNLISKLEDGKLDPINVVDFFDIIGEGVVSGGVRRTALIALVDAEDKESITMKSNLYTQVDGEWKANEKLLHRQMSNNSIIYYEKPSREKLHWQIEQMRFSGEPAFVNAEQAIKRRPNFNGVNPCSEILLDSRGMCNLTEINVMAFVKDGVLDVDGVVDAQILSVRAGIRMTLPEFELHKWDIVNKRDRLIGTSLTGWQDMVNSTDMSKEDQIVLLRLLKEVATSEAQKYSELLNVNEPLLKTTVKPSGTLSLLPSVSAGIHYSHSPYYIRRVRINAHDPLAKAMIEMGYRWQPEVGESRDSANTIVFEFPMQSPSGKTKHDVGAIEQLEDYKMFMENYVEHNVSITVHVNDYEWSEVEQWIWDNWDYVIGISFIPLSDGFYDLMPYEEIEKEQYEKMLEEMPVGFNYELLSKHEDGSDFETDTDCETGICPVR